MRAQPQAHRVITERNRTRRKAGAVEITGPNHRMPEFSAPMQRMPACRRGGSCHNGSQKGAITMSDFSANLEAPAKESGAVAGFLAEELQVSCQTVSGWEREVLSDLDMLLRLCDALHATPDQLYPRRSRRASAPPGSSAPVSFRRSPRRSSSWASCWACPQAARGLCPGARHRGLALRFPVCVPLVGRRFPQRDGLPGALGDPFPLLSPTGRLSPKRDPDETTLGKHLPQGRCFLERIMGVEPTCAAWEAAVLPMNYIRRCPPWERSGIIPELFPHCKSEKWRRGHGGENFHRLSAAPGGRSGKGEPP